jgi:transcriptional regulator with XRE-family HTH domain
MTQQALATAAGLDQTAVSKAETGRLRLEGASLGRVADALGVSTSWLRSGVGVGPVEVPGRAPAPTERPSSVAFAEALEEAFDKSRGHRLVDVDAVRAVFAGQSVTEAHTAAELAGAARKILDAATAARLEGRPVTLAEILMRVAM